jgi:hypothetical protein
MTSNPRESPKTASLGPADGFPSPAWHSTRWQAIRAGMWKAGKLGFFICFSLAFAVCAAWIVAMRCVPKFYEAYWTNGPIEIGPLLIAQHIAGSVAFGILCGAIPGAVIGGIVAGARWRRPAELEERGIDE